MNDIYSRTYMLSITPMGISLISVDSIDNSYNQLSSFWVDIDIHDHLSSSFENFTKFLMHTVGKKIGQKVLSGDIHNGDFLELIPHMQYGEAQVKVSVFRDSNISQNVLEYLEKSTKTIPDVVVKKEKEIECLRNELNNALETRNYNQCPKLIKKINYIKNEFMI